MVDYSAEQHFSRTFCMVNEDLTTNGSWSQRSLSRSMQRAESLLRSTFNPSLRWLFPGRSQDEEETEGHFVVAHNLVSRSSARLLHLQQALLTVAPQWQPVSWALSGSPQVCVKGVPAEVGVLLRASSSSSILQEHYTALWRLLEQRSLLLFIHEYARRARLAAAYVSRVSHLLEESHRTPHQTPSGWSSSSICLGSLSQELRVHLSHWSCLFSKVRSDRYLRPALVQHSRLLGEVKQTLDLLGLQALVLMERYVYVILCAVARAELDSVPRAVLEDILAGTDLYNQAVGEQRVQRITAQLRTAVLQQSQCFTLNCSLPNSRGRHPAAFTLKELIRILAVHQADMIAKQLHNWASEQSLPICQVDTIHEAYTCSDNTVSQGSRSSSRASALRSEWSMEQLQHTYPVSSFTHQWSSLVSGHTFLKTVYIPDPHLDSTIFEQHHPLLAKPILVQNRTEGSNKGQTSRCQTYTSQMGQIQTSVEALNSGPTNLESLDNHQLFQTISPPSTTTTTPQRPLALPLSGVCQQDHSSVELLFQVLVSSNDRLTPLVSHTPAPDAPTEPLIPDTRKDVLSPNKRTDQILLNASRINSADSVCWIGHSKVRNVAGPQQECAEPKLPTRSKAAVRSEYGRDAKEETGGAEGTAVEPDSLRWPTSVQWMDLDLVPEEWRTMLDDICLHLLVFTAHAQWDYEVCRSLGSALKDKCLSPVSQSSNSASEQDANVMMSLTMEHLLLLSPPLLTSLSFLQSGSSLSTSTLTLQRITVSLVLATVQLSRVWVMSKAHQFLSSWSLNKFLLITQGDLKGLRRSIDMMVHQTKPLKMNLERKQPSTLHNHNQILLMQQLVALDRTVSELQTFSSLVLKTFSRDCKRMSGEIFEQTMPSAVHWRPSLRTGFPSCPSEYASLAAQTVIGQVLEGVAPLSEDARIQALSITMTAFMEAWMEHILKQRIKFSVQGALQLKQDFDSIRELIQSDKYGLSAELHQRLLSLRVFQQVDSAVVCLLQQPHARPYVQSRAWEPFTRCCPTKSNRDSLDAAVGSSITNLRCVEGEDLTLSGPTVVTDTIPAVNPSNPGEPYLASSVALGVAQQEWLDLRIQSSSRRWRLPGLQCLSKSEP
ncbi:uncharacterized protein ccdc142 isoform 2-T3 [Spinachia spinachia]